MTHSTNYEPAPHTKRGLRLALGASKPLAVSMIEACGLADIGLTTGWKLLREGQLQGVKVGRRRLILLSSVEQLLQTGGA